MSFCTALECKNCSLKRQIGFFPVFFCSGTLAYSESSLPFWKPREQLLLTRSSHPILAAHWSSLTNQKCGTWMAHFRLANWLTKTTTIQRQQTVHPNPKIWGQKWQHWTQTSAVVAHVRKLNNWRPKRHTKTRQLPSPCPDSGALLTSACQLNRKSAN